MRHDECAGEDFVLDLWRTLLGRAELGRDDNFFSNGGRSIHMKSTVNAVEKKFDVKLGLDVFIDHPTARLLGQRISQPGTVTI